MEGRSTYIDFSKGALIFLMVLAHFAVGMQDTVSGGVSNVIYTFHMPAFIFISGYLSKNVKDHREKDINLLLYPFVIFQMAYTLFCLIISKGSFNVNLFTPVYLTWYLVTLFFCRLFLPYLRMVKTKYCYILLLIVAFTSGFFVTNEFLAFYRTLYFLPIFYFGFRIDNIEVLLSKINCYKVVFYLLFAIVSTGIFSLSYFDAKYYSVIRLFITTDHCYEGSILVAIGKLAGFCLSLFMLLTFFLICYNINRKINMSFFIEIGRNSMSVYVLHGFFVIATIPYIVKYLPFGANAVVCFGMTIFLCWLFSRKKVADFFTLFFDFRKLCNLMKINIYNH